jgi:hypothetical protein
MRMDDVLKDPETSPWLRGALQAALECDPVRAANDAEVLRDVLQRRVAEGSVAAAMETSRADGQVSFPVAWVPAA